MSRIIGTLDIDPKGGPCDRAAAQAYSEELLRIAKAAPVRPSMVWLAEAIQTTRNRLYRVLDVLEIKDEYQSILKGWVSQNPRSRICTIRKMGYIYLMVQHSPARLLKIGWSGNPSKRLAAIQRSNPYLVEILTTKMGTMKDEKQLHAQFAALNVSGEWFLYDSNILKSFRIKEVEYVSA